MIHTKNGFVVAIAASLMVSISSRAEKADDPICSDIHRVACTPGDLTDPSGTSRLVGVDFAAVSQESRQQFKETLKTILKDNAHQKIKKVLLKVAQLPECESNENSDACLDVLSQALAVKLEARYLSGLTTVSLPVAQEGKIGDLTSVLNSPVFADATTKMVEAFKAKAGEADLGTRAEKEIFARVKEVVTLQIQDSISDEKSRALFIERINAIQWGGTSCGADALYSIMTPEIFLNLNDNKLYLCRGIAKLGTSEYGLAFMIAREMANFVGPCGSTRGKNVPVFKYNSPGRTEESEKQFPFKGVLSCLRGKNSLYAQRGMGLSRESVVLCDKSDQISESFADWLATEAMSDYIPKFFSKHSKQERKVGITTLMRSQCMPGAGMELADRPPVEERFNRILLSNPDIRDQLGCKVKPLDVAYCAASNEAPEAPEEKPE
jgi:hypothetical protein